MWTHVEEPLAWDQGPCPPGQGPGQHLGECKGTWQRVLHDTPTSILRDHTSQQTHGWARDGPVSTVRRVWGQRAGAGDQAQE